MRYTESIARSAELARKVLPRIAGLGTSYTPSSYTVWYEHFAGLNPELSRALEAELARQPQMDQSAIDRLHAQHVQARDMQQIEAMRNAMGDLLRKLTHSAAAGTAGAEQFATALQACSHELDALEDPGDLPRIVASLVSATTAARDASEQMREQLVRTQSEMQALREKLDVVQGEAVTDPLTGLLNRRGFEGARARLAAEDGEAAGSASLLMLDIDHFKRINDSYGHLLGDQVIAVTGKILSNAVKGRDIAARFGGEEFIVLLPGTPGAGACALAEQIRMAFSRARIRTSGDHATLDKLTLSVGVAAPRERETLQQQIERADAALYRAKNEGRNCVRLAD